MSGGADWATGGLREVELGADQSVWAVLKIVNPVLALVFLGFPMQMPKEVLIQLVSP